MNFLAYSKSEKINIIIGYGAKFSKTFSWRVDYETKVHAVAKWINN